MGLTKKKNPYGTASREWARWNCGWDAEDLKVRHADERERVEEGAIHA